MIEFQDSRAGALAAQIKAINNAAFTNACVPVFEQTMFNGINNEEKVRCGILNQIVEEAAFKRKSILAEQIEKGISGIEWYCVEYGSIHIKLPRLHDNLKLIPGDKEILRQSKSVALYFLLHWHQVFQLWCYNKELNYPWSQTNWSEFYVQYSRCEWLEIWVEDSIDDVLLLDGICVEHPNFAIHAYCYCHELPKVYNPDAYPFSLGVQFQWNNSTPYI